MTPLPKGLGLVDGKLTVNVSLVLPVPSENKERNGCVNIKGPHAITDRERQVTLENYRWLKLLS